MIIIIDNYDSFTYNLYQYIGVFETDIKIYRNDKITADEVINKNPSHIVISPGPGYPQNAGICIELIKKLKKLDMKIPVLGVCLGHQAIGQAFGGVIKGAKDIVHGKVDKINLDLSCPLFKDLPKSISVGRYHSLIIDKASITDNLEICAVSSKNEIMGIYDSDNKVFGIQFHPESILTPDGKKIIKNFLNISKERSFR